MSTHIKCLCLLLIFPFITSALETQLVEQIPFEFRTQNNLVALNNALLYVSKDAESETLWAVDHITDVKTPLFTAVNGKIQLLDQLNQQVIFTQSSSCCEKVWRSDGTVEGTNALLISEKHGFNSNGPWVVDKYSENQLFRTNGHTTTLLDLDSLYFPEEVCNFENGHVITSSSDGDTSELILNNMGDDSWINLTPQFTDSTRVFFNYDMQNNICFVNVTEYENSVGSQYNRKQIMVSSHGQIQTLFPANSDSFYLLPEYDESRNKFYFIRNKFGNPDFNYEQSIIEVAIPNIQITASYDHLDSEFSMYDLDFLDDKIAIHYTTPDASPALPRVEYVDRNLNRIENLPFNEHDFPVTARWRDQLLVLFSLSNFSDNPNNILLYQQSSGLLSEPTQLNNRLTRQVAASENQQHAYINAYERVSNTQYIYRVNAIPNLSKYTGGQWLNSDYRNQGLSIIHGTRGDLSEYLFITVYTYESGAPLWLAGISELEPNMTSASLPLFRFDGLNTWQASLNAQQTQVGSLVLSHERCDLLNVSFDINDSQASFQVKRMVNITSNNLCQD